MQTEVSFEKINSLPIEKINEIEDFVGFLQAKETRLQMISQYAEQHAGSDVD